MKRLALIMAVIAVALTATAPAYGASSVGDAYGGSGGGILGSVEQGGGGNSGGSSTPAPAQVQVASTEGTLPFTGLDLGLLAIGGIALVGVGVGLRRFARPLS